MKIFLCDNRLGGLLGFRPDVIGHFVQKGHDVTLVVPEPKNDWDYVGVSNLNNVRMVNVRMRPSGFNPFSDLFLFFQYLKLFWSERPDIVFNYTIKPNIYSSIAARICGARVVCMLAGLGYTFSGKGFFAKLLRRFYRFGLSMAEHVFVLNQSNYDLFRSSGFVTQDKLILLKGGEGVNPDYYSFSRSDYTGGVIFMMVSRILYDKGYSEFVEAAKIVHRRYPKVRFELLGPLAFDSPMGVCKEDFERDCRSGAFNYLGVSNNVTTLMGRKNIVLVVPSKYGEGLNRSLMEACAIGRPIITTDIPGCRETVCHGVNGFLVPKANSQALADAIMQFLQLPHEQQLSMGIASRQQAVANFDVKYVIDVYESLLNG